MSKIDILLNEYFNKIQEEDNENIYPHPVPSPDEHQERMLTKIQQAINSVDTPVLCQPNYKWNPQLQRCVPLGDGENIDFQGE